MIHVKNKVDGKNTCQLLLVNIELQSVRNRSTIDKLVSSEGMLCSSFTISEKETHHAWYLEPRD